MNGENDGKPMKPPIKIPWIWVVKNPIFGNPPIASRWPFEMLALHPDILEVIRSCEKFLRKQRRRLPPELCDSWKQLRRAHQEKSHIDMGIKMEIKLHGIKTGWWFRLSFTFNPYLEKITQLTNMLETGWFNHQL